MKCLTEEEGVLSFFVRNAFSKGKSAQKIAYFQPLTMLEIDFTFKNKGGLEYFKEVKLGNVYQTIYYDYAKNCIAIFVAEVLHNLIKDRVKDLSFYTFLETALLWFDTHDETYNFHLILLLEISKFYGFYPAIKDIDCFYFDLEGGVFTNHFTPVCVDEEETILLKRLVNLGFNKEQKVFTGLDRKKLLKLLISYYEQHVSDFRKPKSLEVLQEVFSL